jgi:hypothetical protein
LALLIVLQRHKIYCFSAGVKDGQSTFNIELVQEFATVYCKDNLVDFIPGRSHSSFESIHYPTEIIKPDRMKTLLVKHCRKVDLASNVSSLDEADEDASSTSDEE